MTGGRVMIVDSQSGDTADELYSSLSAETYQRHCPVCGSVQVEEGCGYRFRGVPHHFCSEHCRRRFARRPHLYVGTPGISRSVKQQGRVVPKSHVIAAPARLDGNTSRRLLNSVCSLPGVSQCRIAGDHITVGYDLLVISLKDIEHVVEQEVGSLKGSVTEKAKRKALHFAEACELDNLGHLSNSGQQYHF